MELNGIHVTYYYYNTKICCSKMHLFLDHNIFKTRYCFSSQTLCGTHVSFLVMVNPQDFHIYRPEFFLSPAKKLFLGQAKLAYDS